MLQISSYPKKATFLFVFLTFTIVTFAKGQNFVSPIEPSTMELSKDITTLTTSQKFSEFASFRKQVSLLQEKWSKRSPQLYYIFVQKAVSAINSTNFGVRYHEVKLDWSESLSEEVLGKTDVPLLIKIDLVKTFSNRTSQSDTHASSKKWVLTRRARSEFWLHTWQDLLLAMNSDIDPNEPIMVNVPVPDNSAPAGIEPSAVKDLKVRAEYERAIEENRDHARKISEQRQLKRSERLFIPVSTQYLVTVYSTPPFNLPELKQLLDKYDIGKERKERILNAVIAQMKYAVEGTTSLDDAPPPLPSMVPTPEPTPTPAPAPAPAPQK